MRQAALLVLCALAGCHSGGDGPRIVSFTASPAASFSGESVLLSWIVEGADSVTLLPGGATSGNSQVVAPATTTQYTLTATRGSATATRTLTVAVSPSAVKSFSARPSVAGPGAPVVLSWQLDGTFTTAITENGGPEQAAPGTSFVVHPQKTSTYQLVLHGPPGAAAPGAVPLLVRVAPYSNAAGFAAAPAALQQGQQSTLGWQVDPAGPPPFSWTLIAHPDSGSDTKLALVGAARSLVVEPAVSTTYTLVANGPSGAQPAPPQQRVTVTSHPATALTYTPPAGGTTFSLVASGCAASCTFSLIANQAMTLRGVAFDLPLDAAKVAVSQAGSSVFQQPGAHAVKLGSAGRLVNALVFGSSRLAGDTDVAVAAGSTVATFSLAVVAQGGAGVVFGPAATADKRFRLAVHPAQPVSLSVGTLTAQ